MLEGGGRGSRKISVYVRFAVVAMDWHGEHRAFIVEEYIHNVCSVIIIQRAFRIRFQLGFHDPVPDRKKIFMFGQQTLEQLVPHCKRNRLADLGP
ncbi:hypothetical protein TNIN_84941 [Trichonephila inaurata madagascariensis]|uniref:DUF4817 domain-containing protein n=1 Tax=Trichonephila inaurata madagascariensis TaxID=2747483 RepID=A0A8X6IR50_9ARAC|nr:hypothetical protein TNIN_84941 [Trichonephila inaurata madagascariensis]